MSVGVSMDVSVGVGESEIGHEKKKIYPVHKNKYVKNQKYIICNEGF